MNLLEQKRLIKTLDLSRGSSNLIGASKGFVEQSHARLTLGRKKAAIESHYEHFA